MQRIYGALGALAIYTIMGLFALVVVAVTVMTMPFFILKEIIFPSSYMTDPMESDIYDGVVEAFKTGDIAFLEAFAASDPEFPHGNDGFFEDRWLTNAIEAGNVEAVSWVLDQGVEMNVYDEMGFSPLTSAICSEQDSAAQMVELLIERGSNVNAKGTLDVTPLHVAAAHGSQSVIKALLNKGADPHARETDFGGKLPIDYVSKTRPEIRQLLEDAMTKGN